jgi:hypothetical protein
MVPNAVQLVPTITLIVNGIGPIFYKNDTVVIQKSLAHLQIFLG